MILWLSNLSEPEKWALGFVALFLIGWFSQRLGHELTNGRERRALLVAAAAKLRASFALALGHITVARHYRADDPDRPNVSNFLKEAFVGHFAAFEEFLPFVRSRRRSAYEKAWDEYCELDPATGHAEFMVSDQPNPLQVIEERINNILSYAKT